MGNGSRKAGHEPAMCTYSPESQPNPRLHQRKHNKEVKGGDSAFLLCSGATLPGMLYSALEPSA